MLSVISKPNIASDTAVACNCMAALVQDLHQDPCKCGFSQVRINENHSPKKSIFIYVLLVFFFFIILGEWDQCTDNFLLFLALWLTWNTWLQVVYGKSRTASGVLLETMDCLYLHLFLCLVFCLLAIKIHSTKLHSSILWCSRNRYYLERRKTIRRILEAN